MLATTTKDNWLLCPACGHKLGKVVSGEVATSPERGIAIETKCHSCKNLILIQLMRDKA